MSQSSIASYFTNRKRAAADDLIGSKNKTKNATTKDVRTKQIVVASPTTPRVTRTAARKNSKTIDSPQQQKIVAFIKGGALSPRKRMTPVQEVASKNAEQTSSAFSSTTNHANSERGMKTPTKLIMRGSSVKMPELSTGEVKSALSKSANLQDLKARLGKYQELEARRQKLIAKNDANKKMLLKQTASPTSKGEALKQFKTIDIEVLTSPIKQHRTPTKPITQIQSILTPKKSAKKALFSPAKTEKTVSELSENYAAFEKYASLIERGIPTLTLPYKYRALADIFQCCDTVCSMFFNRKETITFKKLKPAVQRMLRKNFTESHLAQIKTILPEAYNLSISKMRNYGSVSKADYHQLVIIPNIKGRSKTSSNAEDDSTGTDQILSPQETTERLHKFNNILLNMAKTAHDAFLKTLNPPMSIPKDKLTRWHPEFNIDACPDIALAEIPSPPNIERFSSAKDVLSTARNLFTLATPMEGALQRLEEKKALEAANTKDEDPLTAPPAKNSIASVLKGLPPSLLERVRAKQAAKALDTMTRRPSQEQELIKYNRLPDLSRHLRNVFVTEKKGVLPLENVLTKIDNSYRGSLSVKVLEEHLRLLGKEVPEWLTFPQIRNTAYVKMNKSFELGKVIQRIESIVSNRSLAS